MSYLYGTISQTPQTSPIPGSGQTQNDAGGYTWSVDEWKRLERFLILGSEGGTYYASQEKLTLDAAETALRCLDMDGVRTVQVLTDISVNGRAPKNGPALFVLALAASHKDPATRQAAFDVLQYVARIPTDLFMFLNFVQETRGWGRGLRRAVAKWYEDKPLDSLAYQAIKYRQREGWTHADVLMKAHPKTSDPLRNSLFKWLAAQRKGREVPTPAISMIKGFAALQRATDPQRAANIIIQYQLPWEAVPTEFLKSPLVWEALLPHMPYTALIRNLGRMTAVGAIRPMSRMAAEVPEYIIDEQHILHPPIHPIKILAALATYSQGHGARGDLTWDPNPGIIDALNKAFYMSFGNVVSTGKRIMLSLDVSGSMFSGEVSGVPGLTPAMAAATMALVTMVSERNTMVTVFSDYIKPFAISPAQRLDDVMEAIQHLDFSTTDCALPMLYALDKGLECDAFVVYTDSETYAGKIHPVQALRRYRQKTGIPAKLIVVAMTFSRHSIADPDDAGMLDVVGFDTATPDVISDFISH